MTLRIQSNNQPDVKTMLCTITDKDVEKNELVALKAGKDIPFDLGVYGDGRLMNCYGCKKDEDTPPILWDADDCSYTPLIMCPESIAAFIDCQAAICQRELLKNELSKTEETPDMPKTNHEERQKGTSLDEAVSLLGMLGTQRYKYNEWLKTGIIMWNTFGEDNDDAFEAWASWSSKASDVGDGYKECCKKWGSFFKQANPLTIGSLHHMADELAELSHLRYRHAGPAARTKQWQRR